MSSNNVRRRDFAFLFVQHIENNGGIEAVLSELPQEDDYRAADFIRGVYEQASKEQTFGISYKQYFSALGTLVHYEVI